VFALELGRLGSPRSSAVLQCRAQVLETLPLPGVEQARLNTELLADIRDRNLVAEVAAEGGGFLFRGETASF